MSKQGISLGEWAALYEAAGGFKDLGWWEWMTDRGWCGRAAICKRSREAEGHSNGQKTDLDHLAVRSAPGFRRRIS